MNAATTLQQNCLDLRDLSSKMVADYANVRANTLNLNLLDRILFRDAAIRHWWGGAESVEAALRMAREEVCK